MNTAERIQKLAMYKLAIATGDMTLGKTKSVGDQAGEPDKLKGPKPFIENLINKFGPGIMAIPLSNMAHGLEEYGNLMTDQSTPIGELFSDFAADRLKKKGLKGEIYYTQTQPGTTVPASPKDNIFKKMFYSVAAPKTESYSTYIRENLDDDTIKKLIAEPFAEDMTYVYDYMKKIDPESVAKGKYLLNDRLMKSNLSSDEMAGFLERKINVLRRIKPDKISKTFIESSSKNNLKSINNVISNPNIESLYKDIKRLSSPQMSKYYSNIIGSNPASVEIANILPGSVNSAALPDPNTTIGSIYAKAIKSTGEAAELYKNPRAIVKTPRNNLRALAHEFGHVESEFGNDKILDLKVGPLYENIRRLLSSPMSEHYERLMPDGWKKSIENVSKKLRSTPTGSIVSSVIKNDILGSMRTLPTQGVLALNTLSVFSPETMESLKEKDPTGILNFIDEHPVASSIIAVAPQVGREAATTIPGTKATYEFWKALKDGNNEFMKNHVFSDMVRKGTKNLDKINPGLEAAKFFGKNLGKTTLAITAPLAGLAAIEGLKKWFGGNNGSSVDESVK